MPSNKFEVPTAPEGAKRKKPKRAKLEAAVVAAPDNRPAIPPRGPRSLIDPKVTLGSRVKAFFSRGSVTTPKKEKPNPNAAISPDAESILEGTDEEYHVPEVPWHKWVIVDPRPRYALAFLLATIAIPLTVYALLSPKEEVPPEFPSTCIIKEDYRVPCLVGRTNMTESDCTAVSCCWNEAELTCFHRLPSLYTYNVTDWVASNESELDAVESFVHLRPIMLWPPFQHDLQHQNLYFWVDVLTPKHMKFVLSINTDRQRVNNIDIKDTDFDFEIYGSQFSFYVYRRNVSEDRAMLVSTMSGPMISSPGYSELTLQFPSDGAVFGLGTLRPAGSRMFYSSAERTSSLPILMTLDQNGLAHGVFVENSGPLEVELLERSNLVILRALSDLTWNVHIFSGPTPREVMDQLTLYIGRPLMPPYWALGLHVCPDYGHSLTDTADVQKDMEEFVAGAEEHGLPWESHCIHDSLLGLHLAMEDALDFGELPQLIPQDRRLILSLSPMLQVNATDVNVLVDSANKSYIGAYHETKVKYPVWTDSNWLTDSLQRLLEPMNTTGALAGLALIDNYPVNTEKQECNESLPYLPEALGGSLSSGTVCWKTRQAGAEQYLVHNLYSLQHVQAVKKATDNLFLLSGGSAPGTAGHAGTFLLDEAVVNVTWGDFRASVAATLGQGLAGASLTGGPVCGSSKSFSAVPHHDLCVRWYQAAAMLPLLRVSSVKPFRDPVLGFKQVLQATADIARVVELRYSLLPYYYSLMHEATTTGAPPARPMFFHFPEDDVTWKLEMQFLVGEALLVAPVVAAVATEVSVYLPKDSGPWYILQNGAQVGNSTGGYSTTLIALQREIMVLLRAGHIIPMHGVNKTAELSRNTPHEVVIAFDLQQEAQGRMFVPEASAWIIFTANATSLTVKGVDADCGFLVDSAKVYGLPKGVLDQQITVNGGSDNAQANTSFGYLKLSGLGITPCVGREYNVGWSFG